MMRQRLESIMHQRADSIMLVDLGAADDASRFTFLGARAKLPTAEAVIL